MEFNLFLIVLTFLFQIILDYELIVLTIKKKLDTGKCFMFLISVRASPLNFNKNQIEIIIRLSGIISSHHRLRCSIDYDDDDLTKICYQSSTRLDITQLSEIQRDNIMLFRSRLRLEKQNISQILSLYIFTPSIYRL